MAHGALRHRRRLHHRAHLFFGIVARSLRRIFAQWRFEMTARSPGVIGMAKCFRLMRGASADAYRRGTLLPAALQQRMIDGHDAAHVRSPLALSKYVVRHALRLAIIARARFAIRLEIVRYLAAPGNTPCLRKRPQRKTARYSDRLIKTHEPRHISLTPSIRPSCKSTDCDRVVARRSRPPTAQ